MSEEQKIHSFTETYVKLAIRVLELNETSPAKKARTLLTDSLPPPKDLLFNSDVAALTKELFDYGFWGINGKYESLPWDIPATRALYGLLKYEEAKEEFLGPLLSPDLIHQASTKVSSFMRIAGITTYGLISWLSQHITLSAT
jgi:hypothetical protein